MLVLANVNIISREGIPELDSFLALIKQIVPDNAIVGMDQGLMTRAELIMIATEGNPADIDRINRATAAFHKVFASGETLLYNPAE